MGARFYDPEIGRFMQVAPLADDPMQIGLSPYNYAWNNPANITDSDGRCPSCLFGALVGASTDFGVQVAVNLAEGADFGTALTDIDGTSILVSAGAGAVSGGLSVLSKARNASRLVKLATTESGEATLDAAASVAGQLADDGEVSATGTAFDVLIGKVLGDKVEEVIKRKFLNSKQGKILLREADRTKRVAAQNTRPGKQTRAQKAKDNLDKEVAKRTTSASVSSTGVASGAVKEMMDREDEKNN